MTDRLRWCVEMETRCRIPIWLMFGRIQWHVIPQLRVTLQGAATLWIHCCDSRATCHIAGCSHLTKSMSWSCYIAGCKNSIRHIKNRFSPYFIIFLFLRQFRLWRAAAFASSSIHLSRVWLESRVMPRVVMWSEMGTDELTYGWQSRKRAEALASAKYYCLRFASV